MLGNVLDFLAAGEIADAAIEIGEFLEGKGIVEAAHGGFVGDGLESFAGRAANALGGRIRSDELGIFFFELLELIEQLVEGRVGNFRIVHDVIQIFVMANFFAQALDFFGGSGCFGRVLGHILRPVVCGVPGYEHFAALPTV